MNYYLPRYDLPLVLGYTGPGLSFYSPGSEKTNDLIPSFSKQEDLASKTKPLENQSPNNKDDLINTFFSDRVAMLRATLENILSQIEQRKQIKERNTVAIRSAGLAAPLSSSATTSRLNSGVNILGFLIEQAPFSSPSDIPTTLTHFVQL